MEISVPLQTTLIAASVSIIGVLVSLYVSRQSRKTAIDLVILKEEIERDRDKRDKIRKYKVTLQKLRVIIWEVREAIQNADIDVLESFSVFGTLKVRMNELQEEFVEGWAHVVSEEDLELTNTALFMRHDLRGGLMPLLISLEFLSDPTSRKPEKLQEASADLAKFTDQAEELLDRTMLALDL